MHSIGMGGVGAGGWGSVRGWTGEGEVEVEVEGEFVCEGVCGCEARIIQPEGKSAWDRRFAV